MELSDERKILPLRSAHMLCLHMETLQSDLLYEKLNRSRTSKFHSQHAPFRPISSVV